MGYSGSWKDIAFEDKPHFQRNSPHKTLRGKGSLMWRQTEPGEITAQRWAS